MRQQSTPTVEEGKPVPIDLRTATEADIREAIELVDQHKKQLVLPFPPSKFTLALILNEFTCQRCGLCCTTGPQTPEDQGICLFPDEHKRIARRLHVTVKRLRRMCKRDDKGFYHLQYPCPFYDESKRACRIYHQRPFICRQFPLEGTDDANRLLLSSYCPAAKEVAVRLTLAFQRGRENFRARVKAEIYGEVR